MRKIISTKKAPQAIGPYSQAIEINGTLYVSGQIPINPQSGIIPEGISEQTMQVMKNIGAILEAAGYSFEDIVKCTCYLSNMSDFKGMNEVYGSYFTVNPPARVACAVKTLPKDALVEIDVIAVK